MADFLGITLNRPDPAQLRNARRETLVEGARTAEWFSGQRETLVQRLVREVRRGIEEGLTTADVARNIVARNIVGRSRAQANTLAATAFNAVASKTRQEVGRQNRDIAKGYQQVSTLDNRTSLTCIAYAGMAWDFDGNPLNAETTLPWNGGPPRHFNCRSSLILVLKSSAELGIGNIPALDGEAVPEITFDQWLRSKPKQFVDDLLGKGRAELWRDGKITLNQLLDGQGNPLSLDALEDLARASRRRPPQQRPARPRDLKVDRDDQPEDVRKAVRGTFGRIRKRQHPEAQLFARVLTRDTLERLDYGNGAYYAPGRTTIQMFRSRSGDDWDGVFAHEYGHFVDNAIERRRSGTLTRFASLQLEERRRTDARRVTRRDLPAGSPDRESHLLSQRRRYGTDVKAYLESVDLPYAQMLVDATEGMGLSTDDANALLFRIASAVEIVDASGVLLAMERFSSNSSRLRRAWINMADFFGAMTTNKVGFGHSNSYYRGAMGAENKNAEMFANYFSMRTLFPGFAEVMRRFSRNWTQEADKMIEQYAAEETR